MNKNKLITLDQKTMYNLKEEAFKHGLSVKRFIEYLVQDKVNGTNKLKLAQEFASKLYNNSNKI